MQAVEEFESLSRGWDHLGNIARTLGDLQGSSTAIYELIQNADDAPGATRMRFTVTDEALEVWNDGVFERCSDVTSMECEWLGPRKHRCDFHSFRKMASGDKRNRPGTTGAFGVGFTAVYQFTDRPELLSNGEHWIVDEMAPEQSRIQRSRASVPGEGTTFRLPWAVKRSEFREAVRQEPVSAELVRTFVDDLQAAVPSSMPFLKKLLSIETAGLGGIVRYERSRIDDRIRVTSTDGQRLEWLVLTGDFTDEAQQLKDAHPDVIEEARSDVVTVAVPLDGSDPSGLLYATLPTEEPSHLPLLINADFVPASDRKRIRFDNAPASNWNRAAVTAAAGVIAQDLERIASAIGDRRFVALLIGAHDLEERLETGHVEPAFGAFWQAIVSELPAVRVVPIQTGGHGVPASVRLWAEDRELAAAPLLSNLGVHLVDEQVRAGWYRLRSDADIRVLNLEDVAAALRANGLTKRWQQSERSDSLATEDGLARLWSLLDTLLEIRDRSTQQARNELRRCAVAPGWDNAIWPMADVYRTDQETQDLLADVGVSTPFLDVDRLSAEGERLVELVTPANAALVLTWVEERLNANASDVDDSLRLELLRWFFRRWAEIEDNDNARLARLPIFPSAAGSRPLVGLALPGDFRDELGLARVVATDAIPEMRPFLAKLGAPRLTFARYCIGYVPDALAAGGLQEAQRTRLLELLVVKLSEIRDDDAVRAALRPLQLLPCADGVWRPGGEVYLSMDVRPVVGADVHFAAIPRERRSAHNDLYRWLGAADQPRPADVEARCEELVQGRTHHREIAEAIIGHVGKRFAVDEPATVAEYSALRKISWLPAEGDSSRGHAPSAVYAMFQRTLFASQARFLDVAATVQRQNADFLEWLGVESVPEPQQVIDHLLWSASHNQPVREDMWIYLNRNAADPALDALRDKRCLLIAETDTYVKPNEVYWGWHPFGRFRHQLGPKFAEYQALLDRLGVAQKPHPADAIDVLQDVAARHGGEQARLLDEDVLVVNACWRLLSEGLEAETIAEDAVAELATAEAVLDARSWLQKPTDVFFRDSVTLAERFGSAVHEHLIDRPEGLWRALTAAGVRNLSDAVTTRILEQQAAEPGGVVAERIPWRRRLVLRVLAGDDPQALSKLEAFEREVSLVRLSTLVIQQGLDVASAVHASAPYSRGALFLPDEQALLYVEPDEGPAWVEIARELTRALGVDGSRTSSAAAAIRGVLAAASTYVAARELDELGFPALDEAITEEAEPTVASGLGGSPVDDDDSAFPSAEGESPGSEPAREGAAATGDGGPGPSESAGAGAGSTQAGENDGATSGTRTSDAGALGGTSGAAPSQETVQSRLRSYVAPVAAGNLSADSTEADARVERAGVAAAMEFERAHGRDPEEMPPQNPGFDVRSVDPDGLVRIIEVKATADMWGERGVALSSTQFTTAQQRREEFWLYVVDQALSAPRVHPINDPASKVDQYFFDDGWRAIAEDEPVPRPAFEPMDYVAESARGEATPFFEAGNPDVGDLSRADGYILLPTDRGSVDSGSFAVRIAGYGLGLALSGGIALVSKPRGGPEDGDLVLVRLHEQVDPDTGSEVTLRYWTPERDLQGRQLAVRLSGDGSVEPLTVTAPMRLLILGYSRATYRWTDLPRRDGVTSS